ncbi:MAG TPA: OmpA family protein [Thermoanaerobaculaceae bacterium]|nr:OmpA family protein [Thermoanaerobaculaceae bacterium]HPS80180.1 OmpA family protein [Thermoanaerobaculaceae bacterium]
MLTPRIAALIALLGCGVGFAAKPDKAGCTDHPLFPTRMPNYRIDSCEVKAFDSYQFFVKSGPKHAVEGKFTLITYVVEDRKDDQSGLAVVRNYENAIKKIGGTIAASDPQRWINGSVMVDGREVWVQAEKGNGAIWLRIVEKQAMEQHIVADAASFGNDLKATGHVAVEGIYFDTDKAEVKPASGAALAEIAKLLGADATLKLYVVGHTDNVGALDHNLKLSQARAAAVVGALVNAHGVAASRLTPFGAGPVAPVATNQTEEGRARNRRVELVAQ